MQKNKKFSGNAVFVLAMLMILGGTISMSDSSPPVDTCNDGIDNDGDGAADGADFECNSEAPMYDGDEDGSHDQSDMGLRE